jgi:hypothetical protein
MWVQRNNLQGWTCVAPSKATHKFCFLPLFFPLICFIGIYSLYMKDLLWHFQIGLYYTLVRSPPLSLPLNSFPTWLKTIILFLISIHHPYSLTLISFIHPVPLYNYPPHPVTILQSCLSVLVSKLTFKDIAQCIPTVSIPYFGPFNPFHYSPLPLYLPTPVFQQLSIRILIFFTFTYDLFYNIVDASLFSFPFPPTLSSIE